MRLADYSQVVTPDQLDFALRAGGFDGVWHYTSGLFARRREDPAVVAEIRLRGWPQGAIDVPTLGTCSGVDAAGHAVEYGYPPGSVILLDVEPAEFKANPGLWAAAAARWCDWIRDVGFTPAVYGTDATLDACGKQAELVVRARPGMCDPAGPGLQLPVLAGHRAVQCEEGTWAGVTMDVTYSEFSLEGVEMLSQGFKTGLAHAILYAVLLEDPTPQALADFANTINSDGSNLADLVQGFVGLRSNADVVRLLPETLADQVAELRAEGILHHHHAGGETGPAIADPV